MDTLTYGHLKRKNQYTNMQTHKLPILLSRNTVKHAVGYSNAGYDINRRVNRHTGAHPNTNNTGTQHKDTQPNGHSKIHTCMHA